VRTRDNTDFGMVVGEADHPRIERNVFTGNGTSGLVMFDSVRVRVLHNTVSGSLGYAVALFAIDDSHVSGNLLTDDDHGILLNNGSRNTLSENTVFHTRGSAIDVGGDDLQANRIQRNRLVEDGDGIILVQAQGTLVERNIITRTGFFGFTDTGGFGVLLDGTHDTVLRRNVVTGGRGPAVWVTTLEAPGAARGDRLLGNVTNSAGEDGIRVDSGATGTIVDRNTSDRNGDDGIDVDAPATTLTRNTTNRNADLGIEAVPGVTDGGRNAASRNGNALQCLNVSCVSHDSR
jgi:parallel beta-helix repeat protein